MAEERVTKVTYDVSDAIDALDDLDAKVKQTATNADKGFNKAGKSSLNFESILKRISPTAGNLLGEFKALAAAGITPLGVAAGAAGAAFAGLLAQVVDIPEAFKDALAEAEALRKGIEDLKDAQIRGGDIEDAQVLRQFEERRRQLTAKQADVGAERNQVSAKKDELDSTLKVYKKFYDNLKQLAKENADERKDIEDQLADAIEARNKSKAGGGQVPTGKAALDTAAMAEKAAFQKDFESAKTLIAEAKQLAADAGGGGIFDKTIGQAEDTVIRALEAEVQLRKNRDAQIAQGQAVIEANAGAIKKEADALAQRNKELARERRGVGVEMKDLGLEQKAFQDRDQVTEAERERLAILQQINQVRETERGSVQKITDLLRGVKDQALGKDTFGDTQQIQKAEELANKIAQGVGRGTVGDVQNQGANIEELTKLIGQLEAQKAAGKVSAGLEFNLQNLREANSLFAEIQKNAITLSQLGVGANTQLGSGLPGAPSAASSLNTPQSSRSTNQTVTNNQNVTVTANIKGGMLDGETMKQITELIRREVRLGNSPKSSSGGS